MVINHLKKIINFLENQPLNFNTWLVAFLTLSALNLFFQFITYNFPSISAEYFIGEVIQPYYLILYLSITLFLFFITRKRGWKKETTFKQNLFFNPQLKKTASFVLWGFWAIIFWPIIDKIILGNNFHISFYLYAGPKEILKNFFLFFGPLKPVGILYGTRIEIIFIVIITTFYTFLKKRNLFLAIFAGLGVYSIFYLTIALPSIIVFITNLFQKQQLFNLSDLDVVKFFNTPLQIFALPEKKMTVAFFYKISLIYNLILLILLLIFQTVASSKIFQSLTKNIRFPQILFNFGLVTTGFLLGLYYFPENARFDFFSTVALINIFLAVLFSWLFAVIINDLEDYQIDQLSNKNRPLVAGKIPVSIYKNYALIFLLLASLFAISVSGTIFSLIALYFLLTSIYSKYPFKLKRFPWISGLVSALASLLFFLVGYHLSAGFQMNVNFPWQIVIFLFFAYSLILPIKDLKDIEADKTNNIITIANLFGEKNARLYFGTITFLLYLGSVWIFQNKKLFFPALIIGSLNYWIINNPKNKRDTLLFKIIFSAIIYLILLINL